MAEYIDRPRVKAESKELLRDAQVPVKSFFLIYLLMTLGLNTLSDLTNGSYDYSNIFSHPLGLFALVLTALLSLLLAAGSYLYCLSIRRGERAEYLTLFDGFSFAGKIILLTVVEYIFVFLWSMLFFIPGIIAAYRYRFALFNLYEDPSIGVMEAMEMSKQQTSGYKGQLFLLDLSYIGWVLLALLPNIIYSGYISFNLRTDPLVVNTPSLLLSLLFGLWAAAVQLFYLPVYQTTELGFFTVAKHSSHIGAGESSLGNSSAGD